MFDPNTEFGQRVTRRLRDEEVIWLTTVRSDLTPQPTPVWFLWDGETFLIYTLPGSQKLSNLAYSPRVALHLNSNASGGDVIVFYGVAVIDASTPAAIDVPPYLEKYRKGIGEINSTPERFSAEYSVPVRVKPTHMHGF